MFITEGEIRFLSYNLLHKTPWHYTILPLERYQPSLAHLFMFKWDTALLSVLKFRNKIRIIQAQKRIDVVFCILSLSLSCLLLTHEIVCACTYYCLHSNIFFSDIYLASKTDEKHRWYPNTSQLLSVVHAVNTHCKWNMLLK